SVEGDHLIPVVWNGRLYIFWPLFTLRSPESGDLKNWEIHMAWSEYRHGKWQPKRKSTSRCLWPPQPAPYASDPFGDPNYAPSTFTFKAFPKASDDDQDLRILVYHRRDLDSPLVEVVKTFAFRACGDELVVVDDEQGTLTLPPDTGVAGMAFKS